ncbi:ABC transporter permease subunit [Cytobacillus dafuensis]|uniref:ABC transporter permease n=1 Tax=Cytobacillus dafuensis TaxID=1742359 RepID=A0A5B8Z6F0_CYTDA|nr:ABC transporter permease subunit [Cytobacillus dafuensis]QED48487.1 ABC transporter permease [Cytobacillus dafuensis]
MNHLFVLLKKEWLEARRSYKILWFPVVFMFLGIIQPLSSYYLPQILQIAGGLPEGIEITLPKFTAEDVLASTLTNQFDQLGLIIIVIGMMGIIVSEKNNGMLAFILTRNTRLSEYLLSKWIGQAVIVAGSVAIGILMAIFYTSYLFNTVSFARVFVGLGVYYIWCLFILTFALMLGAVLSRSSAVAVLSIFVLILLKAITAFGAGFQILNPAYLTNHAVNIMISGNTLPHLLTTVTITLFLIVLFMFLSKYYLNQKELPSM